MKKHEITSAISHHQKVLQEIERHWDAWEEIAQNRADSGATSRHWAKAWNRAGYWAEQHTLRSNIITQLEAKSKEVQS